MYSVTCYVRHYSHIERARDQQLSAETRLGIYGAPCRARLRARHRHQQAHELAVALWLQ